MKLKLLGVINAYNEEDCIGRAVRSLVDAEHHVRVFDHASTDRTIEVALEAGAHEIELVTVGKAPRGRPGKPSRAIWSYVSRSINKFGARYNWVTWQAADELIFDPWGSPISKAGIEREIAGGVQVIRPLIMEFWPTAQDPAEADCPDYVDRLRWYTMRPRSHAPRSWLLKLTGTMPRGLHRADRKLPRYRAEDEVWPPGTRVSNNRWQLRHYPIRTREQAERKIMRERPWNPPQYRAFRRTRLGNLLRPTKGMRRLGA